MNILPCEVTDGWPSFGGRKIQIDKPVAPPASAKRLEVGVRPEFVSFAEEGIPVEIVKVSDAGRYRIVDARHGAQRVKLLIGEDATLPAGAAHIRLDPAHTQIYADGWIVP